MSEIKSQPQHEFQDDTVLNQHKIMHVHSFFFIGIQSEIHYHEAQNDITALWDRFTAERVFHRIKNKTHSHAKVIYTKFQPDRYMMMIGYSIADCNTVPEGMVAEELPDELFMRFVVKNNAEHTHLVQLYNDLSGIHSEYWNSETYHFEEWSPEALAYDDDSVVHVYISGSENRFTESLHE